MNRKYGIDVSFSPAKWTLLPWLASCWKMLSSVISYEAKLDDTSIKVGRLPVVRPAVGRYPNPLLSRI